MPFESYKPRETDPEKDSRRAKINEILGRLDTNTMADSFDRFKVEFRALLNQNPGMAFEDAVDVFGQIVAEERQKPKEAAEEKQNGKITLPSPRLRAAVGRAISRAERADEIEAIYEASR